MIRIGHLGTKEFIALVTIYSSTNVFLSYPQILAVQVGPAAWMVPLLTMIAVLAIWIVLGPMLAKLHGSVLEDNSKKVTIYTRILSIIGVMYFVTNTTSEMRQFTETILVTVLPRSPISFIAIPFLLTIIYFVYKGLEGMTRAAWLLGTWFLGTTLVFLLLTYNFMHLWYLQPILGKGIPQLLSSSGAFLSAFNNVLLLTFMAPFLRDKKQIVAGGVASIVAVAVIYSVVSLFYILTFPITSAEKSPFPVYELARLVYVGRFFQRAEAIFVFIWVANAVIKMAVGLFAATYLYASAFRMPVYRPMVIPMAILVYTLSFIPDNYLQVYKFDSEIFLRWSWIVSLGLAFLFVMRKRLQEKRVKGGEPHADPSTS